MNELEQFLSKCEATYTGSVSSVGELAPMVDFGLKAVPLDRFVEDEYLDLEVLGNTCENPYLEFEE